MSLDEIKKLAEQADCLPASKLIEGGFKPKICENDVQVGLFHYLQKKGHHWIAPNVTLFYTGEMDVCSVLGSNLVNEYEIKLSRADFKKDFKKPDKHPVIDQMMFGIREIEKGGFMGKYPYKAKISSANYFYFVAPKGMIKPEELPHYAGLIEFPLESVYDLRTIKRAKQIHDEPISDKQKQKIANALMWRCWTAKRNIKDLNKVAK